MELFRHLKVSSDDQQINVIPSVHLASLPNGRVDGVEGAMPLSDWVSTIVRPNRIRRRLTHPSTAIRTA